ncbi:hypothetical protein X975_19011, partial [Stegodyphus mimosarum]
MRMATQTESALICKEYSSSFIVSPIPVFPAPQRSPSPTANIIELIPGRDGKVRTVKLKTQHGSVLRPVQWVFSLELQAVGSVSTENKKTGEEESSAWEPSEVNTSLSPNDIIMETYTSSGRCVKAPKRSDLFNCICYKFETLLKSQRAEHVAN